MVLHEELNLFFDVLLGNHHWWKKKNHLLLLLLSFFLKDFFPPWSHLSFQASWLTFPKLSTHALTPPAILSPLWLCVLSCHTSMGDGWLLLSPPPHPHPLHTHRVRFPMFVGREGGFPFQHVWLVNISLASKVIQWKTGGIFLDLATGACLTMFWQFTWHLTDFFSNPQIYILVFLLYIFNVSYFTLAPFI